MKPHEHFEFASVPYVSELPCEVAANGGGNPETGY